MKKEISSKFETVNERLNQLEENIKNNLEQQIKKRHYYQLPKTEQLTTSSQGGSFGKEIKFQECYISRIDQYSKRNNIEIQSIPKTAKDEELESKVIDIFSAFNVSISSKDVQDCHPLVKMEKVL